MTKAKKFSSLVVSDNMLKTLESLNYQQMTPIQEQALPDILNNKDVIAQAETGSGKTAAYAIGILEHLEPDRNCIQGLVMCPTRELADQVSQEFRKLARLKDNVKILTLCGGKPFRPQVNSLESGAHIIVGTPGRILAHIRKNNINFTNLQKLVLDEADRMLDLGFQDDLLQIVSNMPTNRQTLLFSATYPDEINEISCRYLINPVKIKVKSLHDHTSIKQTFYKVDKNNRDEILIKILSNYKPCATIIFCNTKTKCDAIESILRKYKFQAFALHGDLDQLKRDKILIQFANKSCSVLVATDVAARGLDITDLDCVINYELANTAATHMHRIGRTGRAGKQGQAISLFEDSESHKVQLIEEYQNLPIVHKKPSSLKQESIFVPSRTMRTICISGGRKQKLRAGDIVGALTGEFGLSFDSIGKINIGDYYSYVAIQAKSAQRVYEHLKISKIKNRKFGVQLFK